MFWLGDKLNVVMIIVLGNDSNMSNYWWKSYSRLKYIIFDEGIVLGVNFSVWRAETVVPVINSETGDHTFPNLLLCSSNLADEKYLSLLICGTQHLIVALLLV